MHPMMTRRMSHKCDQTAPFFALHTGLALVTVGSSRETADADNQGRRVP
jgi:hypothetical protein